MRILHFIINLDLEDGGTVRAVLDLARHSAERGHTVTILTATAPHAPEDWDGQDGRPKVVTFLRTSHPLRPIPGSSLPEVKRLIDDVNVLHLHGIWQTEFIQLTKLARASGTPYVITTHGMLDDWCTAQKSLKKLVYYRLFLKRMLAEAAVVHCTATAEIEQSQKWFPLDKGNVIPYMFDLEPFRSLPGPEPARKAFPNAFAHRPLLLFLSRLHVKKGLERLIEAAKILAGNGVEFLLAIAGTGESTYVNGLKRKVEQAGLANQIRFIGFASGVEKVSLYQAADVFVLPTSQENFGFVLPEALACGTMVITTKGVDIWPELTRSGGAVITPEDPQSIADAITDLLSDEARRDRMSSSAREWIFDWLDPSRLFGEYEAMYQSACK